MLDSLATKLWCLPVPGSGLYVTHQFIDIIINKVMMKKHNNKTALIFGISGQDGAYLSRFLLEKGYSVHGTSRDAEATSFKNLEYLGIKNRVRLCSSVPTDLRSVIQTISLVQPNEIYNLSGQSSVGLSFSEPAETLESNILGTLNQLEAIRSLDKSIRFYNAVSSECFGDTKGAPATEETPFHPLSPYAVAKSASFWEVANFREVYDLHACSGILFNHESPLRPTRFVTRKIVNAAAGIAAGRDEKLRLGNIDIHRDWGWAPEYVEAIWLILQQDRPEDILIATGESHPLAEFVSGAFDFFGLDWRKYVEVDEGLKRPSDIAINRADPGRAAKVLNWRAHTSMPEVVRKMATAEKARLEGDENWALMV